MFRVPRWELENQMPRKSPGDRSRRQILMNGILGVVRGSVCEKGRRQDVDRNQVVHVAGQNQGAGMGQVRVQDQGVGMGQGKGQDQDGVEDHVEEENHETGKVGA